MTEQPTAGKQPPVPSPGDAAQERVEKLRAELAMAEAALPPVPGTVRVRVMPPHESLIHAGTFVGRDFTPVPAGELARLSAAAADAGVVLEEA